MYEILDAALSLLTAGRPFTLVTLVADRGSTPRAAGAEMLVRDDGSIAGTIGGGLLEHSMMQAAAELDFERAAAIRDRISGMRGEGSGGSPRRAGGRGRKGGSGGGSAGRIPRPKR